MKAVIVTGASSGIGEEFVRQLDERFSRIDEIWMIARNKAGMEETARELKNFARVFPLDLVREGDIRALSELFREEKPEICMLVNCAGYGLMGEVSQIPLEEQLGMIDLNCKALTAVTCLALPYLVRNARILQVASAAAFAPQKNFAVYAATKAYVLSFSRALQEEVRSREVFVTAVCPGPVDTPFFTRAGKYGQSLKAKEKFTVSPARVVTAALNDSKRRRSVSVCGLPIKAFHGAAKLLPHDIFLELAQYMEKGD